MSRDVRIYLILLLAVAFLGGLAPAHAEIWNVESRLSLQNESFVSTDYISTPKKSYMFMGASMVSKDMGDKSTPVFVDARGLFSPDSPVLSTFNISELYFSQSNFSVGRKRHTWSQGDEDWNLGIMQPQYRWNVLRPQSQGLTGAFFAFGQEPGDGWNLQLFGTPAFLPDQGAGYVLSDGRFQKVNPWFQSMPQEVRLAGTNKTRMIDYQVTAPQLEKIVFNSGYAAQLSYDKDGVPYRFSAAVAYKPMNVLSMGVDGWAEAGNRAPVVIVPTVAYHRVATTDLQMRAAELEWRVGLAMESSDEPRDQRAELTYAKYTPMLVTTASFGYILPGLETRVLFINREGGDKVTAGPKAEDFSNLFPQRLPYKQAVAVDAKINAWRSGPQRVDISTRWTEGLSDEFSRWTLDATYQINSQWSFWTDVVFVRASRTEGADAGLFSNFENHDSVRTGVSYAF